MPPKILALLGLSFFLVATATHRAVGRWLDSRIFTPLERYVSLDDAHLRPPPFEINLEETYFVRLELNDSVDDIYKEKRCSYKTIEGSQWRLYRLSSAGADTRALTARSGESTEPHYFYMDSFSATPGRYQLEWDIPAAAPCLNPRHPRLSIWTGPYDYRDYVALTQDFCVFLGGTGLALLVMAYRRFRRVVPSPGPRIFTGMAMRQVVPVVRHAPIPLISQLPHWGLLWGSVVMVLMILYMADGRLTSKGVPVGWRKPNAMVIGTSPWSDTLEIYVRTPARFFVNREEVQRDELRSKLREQLGHRVEWTVFVEADPDVNFGDVLHAMDVIRSCGGNVSWITPQMREEWQEAAQSAAQ
jgi:biopolymer transport protein ExbD